MKKLLLLLVLVIFASPLFFILMIVTMLGGQNTTAQASEVNGVTYVEHWSGKDAYTHHFLAQRYGITSEQINGFIKSQGYNPTGRASGESFLKAQTQSGIDVRVLVAFAQMESSYGTAGVAKDYPDANIWGYGCFDNDPNQGRNWGPERAFTDFRENQIERLGNSSLQIMDERAQQNASGTFPAGKGVYYTDTSGTGKARAKVMEDFDKYIDEHGGTPKPPHGSGSSAKAGGGTIAVLDSQLGQSVWGGQCYMIPAYYAQELGGPILRGGASKKLGASGMAAADIGSDYDWNQWGWTVVQNPKANQIQSGDIICWNRSAFYSADGGYQVDSTYGHVAVVGEVKGNNKIMIYDQNPSALQYHEITITDNMFASTIRKGK